MPSQPAEGGTGSLYEHSEAAQRAAEEDVVIPGSDDSEETTDVEDDQLQEHLTGDRQAAINRDIDPPA